MKRILKKYAGRFMISGSAFWISSFHWKVPKLLCFQQDEHNHIILLSSMSVYKQYAHITKSCRKTTSCGRDPSFPNYEILHRWTLRNQKTNLYTVVASSDPPLLNVDIRRRMSKFAFLIRPGALSSQKFTTNFHLQHRHVIGNCPTKGHLSL